MKYRILKLAENVTDQQKWTLSPLLLYQCLEGSIDTTKSARLAVFARYCVGNVIKEELIAITSLLTTKRAQIFVRQNEKLVIMALYRSPLTVTLWPSSFLKKYGPMIPPAHQAHQTVSFLDVTVFRHTLVD
ncbi:hypothetical protein TNCV_1784371 [Trichonephila clavipes]|nr:hypothetical protein TNCV_1784371 [Trichonephila clavipes]